MPEAWAAFQQQTAKFKDLSVLQAVDLVLVPEWKRTGSVFSKTRTCPLGCIVLWYLVSMAVVSWHDWQKRPYSLTRVTLVNQPVPGATAGGAAAATGSKEAKWLLLSSWQQSWDFLFSRLFCFSWETRAPLRASGAGSLGLELHFSSGELLWSL